MTLAERDPRVDPQPGDVVRNGPFTYTVKSTDGGIIVHEMRDVYRSQEEAATLEQWRGWARTVEIVATAHAALQPDGEGK